MNSIIAKYKKSFPSISASWDVSDDCLNFTDIDRQILSSGVSVLTCSLGNLFAGIYKPNVYKANTLWNRDIHDINKIARVIAEWENGTALSPVFLVKHGELDMGLVADGKHRLTVSDRISVQEIPFMVQTANCAWVMKAIPTATLIRHIVVNGNNNN